MEYTRLAQVIKQPFKAWYIIQIIDVEIYYYKQLKNIRLEHSIKK